MLCGECEDLLSTYEKQFADCLFLPYMKDGMKQFSYKKWLYYFITSVSWRHLYLDLLDFVENHVVGIEALENLISSEKIMRDFLLEKRDNIGNIENHVLFFEDIKEISEQLKELQPHVSIHRSVCGYTVANEKNKTYFTVTNMMGIFLFTLYNKGKDEFWENTQIINGIGTIKAENQIIESVCGHEITELMYSLEKGKKLLSKKQQNKINEKVTKIGMKIKEYPIFEDFKKDREL